MNRASNVACICQFSFRFCFRPPFTGSRLTEPFAECTRPPTLEIVKDLRWFGITHDANYNVKMIEHDRDGMQFSTTIDSGLAELAQQYLGVSLCQVYRRPLHQYLRCLFQARNVLVIARPWRVVNKAMVARWIARPVFPYTTDETSGIAWQPVPVTRVR
jgi:hypothetical protein